VAGPLTLKSIRAPGAGGSGVAATGSGTGGGALSILPEGIAPVEAQFLIRASQQRLGGSFAASLTSHVIGIAIVALVLSLAPERVYEAIAVDRRNYGIVWLPEEGPGGGGGGGGNESLELPPLAQIEGPEEAELSVPIEEPVPVVEPEPEPEPLDTQELSIPALPVASAPETLPGVLEGLRAESESSQGRGTGGGAGSGDGGGAGPGQGDGLGPGEGGGVGGGVYRPGTAGLTIPRLLREVTPQYTAEAMRARIQGTVWLDVVVLPTGEVGDVEVSKSLDQVFGLDEQAIAAAQQWLFAPGLRFGEPVAVLVSLELFFNLR
jgi:TonB family protein